MNEFLVQTWPLLQPVVVALVVQGIKMGIDATQKVKQSDKIKHFLPYVSGVLGAAWAIVTGDSDQSVQQGIVAGLAATGLHQAVHQPMQLSKKGK